jgi:plasmid stabilization system protein ParE
MVGLSWTEHALHDIDLIANYIAQDSLEIAKRFVNAIFRKEEQIIKFPYSGRIVPEYEDDKIRELFYYPYRIIYEIFPDRIEVLTVLHGHRKLQL